ncbi:hypothetical protein CPC16_008065, partial [Podila verticillata]
HQPKMRFFTVTVALSAIAMIQAAPTPANKRSDAAAQGQARNSPGLGSGNVLNVPVVVPVNACGNSVFWIGLLNPTSGNACENH